MKIGIITFHSSHNYGAFLQAYALRAKVEQYTGARVEIINFIMERADAKNRELAQAYASIPLLAKGTELYPMFEASVKRYQTLSEKPLMTDDLDAFNRYVEEQGYDLVIAGSDEIWKTHGYRGFPNPYWLTSPKASYEKYAYAVSSRTPFSRISPEQFDLIASYLSDFQYIGVRDEPTHELVERCCGKTPKLHYNCDPTFLWDFKADRGRGRAIIRERFGIPDDGKKVIALMSESDVLAREVVKRAGDRFSIVPLYRFYPETGCPYIPDPFEWIDIIAASDCVITTFFHGTVFSMKNNVPFLSFEIRPVTEDRICKTYDVLKRHGLEDRFRRLNDEALDLPARVGSFLDRVAEGGEPSDFTAVCRREAARSQSFFDALDALKSEKNRGFQA